MLQPVLFTYIGDCSIPCTGLFCSRFVIDLLPGTHIIFNYPNNEEKYVCCIISCSDRINAVINKYEYYSNWYACQSTPVLTDSWSLDLEELVITDTEVQIEKLEVINIAFVFLENKLNEYEHHDPLHGIDNVYIVQSNNNGKHMVSFNSFSKDFVVPGWAAVCKIAPKLIVSQHAKASDCCKEVYKGIKQI